MKERPSKQSKGDATTQQKEHEGSMQGQRMMPLCHRIRNGLVKGVDELMIIAAARRTATQISRRMRRHQAS